MKANKMKTLALSAAVLTMALSLSACGGGNNDNDAAASPSPSAASAASPSASPAMATETESASPSSSSDEAQVMSGKFNGMIDGHTIEIETGAGAVAYQVDADTADKVSTWEEGTSVKFQYKENTITVIDKE